MPRASHSLAFRRKPKKRLIPIYAASLLLVFHTFVVAYINSSYLEQFLDTEGVGTIYTAGSVVSVFVFLFISHILRSLGNFKLTAVLLALNFMAVFGMSYTETLTVALPLFLVHLITVPMIVFNLDIFMERQIGTDEGSTATRRGLLLTLVSFVGAVSPFASSLLVEAAEGSFEYAYFVSAITLLPIFAILISFFSDFEDDNYEDIKLVKAVKTFWQTGDLKYVFVTHFVLQMLFFALVVYAPIFMTQNIGLTWAQFGITMFFGQLAYVLFEYPIGIIADKYIGEKEMMGLGFLIIAISLSWMSFVTTASVVVWAIIMFMIRVGASFVEVTTEAHFFKQTDSSDAQVISFFRVTRPLAYVVGAVFSSVVVLYLPFNFLFTAFACLMIPALFFTLAIKDTR